MVRFASSAADAEARLSARATPAIERAIDVDRDALAAAVRACPNGLRRPNWPLVWRAARTYYAEDALAREVAAAVLRGAESAKDLQARVDVLVSTCSCVPRRVWRWPEFVRAMECHDCEACTRFLWMVLDTPQAQQRANFWTSLREEMDRCAPSRG